MSFLLLAVRMALAVVFTVAGVAKLADRQGARQAAFDFAMPGAIATIVAIALPLGELVVALLLIPVATAWWGALAALALLGVFLAGISYNLARGRHPDCHCFGQLHSQPVGWRTLGRNAILAALATLVVIGEPTGTGLSAFAWISILTPSEAVLLGLLAVVVVAISAQGWFVAELFSQRGRILARLDALEARIALGSMPQLAPFAMPALVAPTAQGLAIGAPAPPFVLSTPDGGWTSMAELLKPKRPVLLLFMDPNCGPCTALLPDVARWQREHAEQLTLVVVSRKTAKDDRKKFGVAGVSNVLLQAQNEVSDRYAAHGTPSAVLVRADGRVGSAVAAGIDAINALMGRVLTSEPMAPSRPASDNGRVASRPIGTIAPELKLRDLDGHSVDLTSFRGRDTLVLLWNPTCSFCELMLPELRAWEAAAALGAPQLVVVSTGTVAANRAMGLQSTVLLDESFAAGRAFGAGGTPCAILIDSDGTVASDVALGAKAVFALAAPVELLGGPV